MADSGDSIREGIVETCAALREVYNPLRSSIETGFGQVEELLDRPEAYQYDIYFSRDWTGSVSGMTTVETKAELDSYVNQINPDTGESIVEKWDRYLTIEAYRAREYAKQEDAFTLTGHVSEFEIIPAALETPIQLCEVLLGLLDGAVALDDLKSRVDDSQKGGRAGPNDHPVGWSGVGAKAYYATLNEFGAKLDSVTDAVDKLGEKTADLLVAINADLMKLAELGSQIKTNLTTMVSDLAGQLNPAEWLGILQTFAAAMDGARDVRETTLRNMADAAAANIKSLVDAATLSREFAEWPKVDGNINPKGTGGWSS